ncbi:hypothetical protein [Methanobrevibacter sp.]|uniref:hypothetical protein n=1 Tax=Methanobrevibacter sp. TaxID=66852 RepID=UPI003863F415
MNCDNMKKKYLIIVGLILAVLTIGAVSASDDANNLTADDAQGEPIQETPEDDGVLEDPTDDYEKRIDVPEEIVMKDGWSYDCVLVELPNDASGSISAYLDDDDEPFYYEEYTGYYTEIYFNDFPLTFSNHTLKLNYTGDSNYKGFQNIYQLNVTYDLSFERESHCQWGEDKTIQVWNPTDINGDLTLVMNGKSYPFVLYESWEDGFRIYNCVVREYNFGINNFTITVSNDPKYPDKSFKGSFDVSSLILIEYPYSELGYPMRYSDEGNITLAMPDDAEGTLNVTVDGVQFADAKLSDGKFFVSLVDVSVGKHIISVNYTGSDYSVQPIEDFEFSVVPYVSVPKFIYTGSEDNHTVTVVLDDNASEVLNIVIKGDPSMDSQYSVELYNKVANGTVTVDLPKLNSGIYAVYVKYADEYVKNVVYDDQYNYFKIDARSENPNFDLNVTFPDTVEVERNAILILNDAPKTGAYKLYINGEYTPCWDSGWDLEFYTDRMRFGENDVTVIFEDTEGYYNQSSASGKITMELRGVPEEVFNYDPIYVALGQNEGLVNLKIDGKNFGTELIGEGGVYFDIESLSIGPHTYEITYYDLQNVKVASKSGSFNVTYEFYTNIGDMEYPLIKEFELIVFIPADINGTVRVSVDGKNYTATYDGENHRAVLTNLVMGENNVTVSFAGDDKYPAGELHEVIYCTHSGFYVVSHDDSFAYISLFLPENATGNITIYKTQWIYDLDEGYEYLKEGEKLVSVKLENGYAVIRNEDLNLFGEYTLIAKYENDDGYPVEDETFTFIKFPKIEVDREVIAGQNASISVEMNAAGNLTISKLNKDDEYDIIAVIPFVDGKAQCNITLPIGNYNILLDYQGSDINNPFGPYGYDYYLDVSPLKVEIPYYFNSDGSGQIIFELPEGVTGKVSVYERFYSERPDVALIENAVYTSSNKTIAISLSQGEHMIGVVFTDDETGAVYSTSGEVVVPKPAADEGINIPETVYDDAIDITLPKDATGGILVMIDDNVTYIPLVNGSAKIDVSKLAKGDHTIFIKYNGDENYSGFEKTVNVTLKEPVDPKITADDLNVIYTAGTKYSATVYGIDGKVAPGTSVTFLINGKAFKTVNADKNGVASVVITQTPGTYKITTQALGKSVTKTLTVKHVLKLQKVKVKRSAKKLIIKATLAKVNGKYLKGKKITLKFKGKKYTAKTNKKGVAKFTIKKKVLTKLKKGKKVTYQATYLKDTVKYTVKVKK